jgi:hypothetical protein
MSQRKQYCLVNLNSREIAKGRRGKPILSERPRDADGNLTFPAGYSQRAGWHWTELFDDHPKLGVNQMLDLERPSYHWPDWQKAEVLRKHPIIEKKQP